MLVFVGLDIISTINIVGLDNEGKRKHDVTNIRHVVLMSIHRRRACLMKLNNIYKQIDDVVTRKVMDETLLVPISGELASMDELYTLNDTGAFIWQALDGIRTLAEIGKLLEQEFDAPMKAIEADLLEIMSGLAEAGLVVSGT